MRGKETGQRLFSPLALIVHDSFCESSIDKDETKRFRFTHEGSIFNIDNTTVTLSSTCAVRQVLVQKCYLNFVVSVCLTQKINPSLFFKERVERKIVLITHNQKFPNEPECSLLCRQVTNTNNHYSPLPEDQSSHSPKLRVGANPVQDITLSRSSRLSIDLQGGVQLPFALRRKIGKYERLLFLY